MLLPRNILFNKHSVTVGKILFWVLNKYLNHINHKIVALDNYIYPFLTDEETETEMLHNSQGDTPGVQIHTVLAYNQALKHYAKLLS